MVSKTIDYVQDHSAPTGLIVVNMAIGIVELVVLATGALLLFQHKMAGRRMIAANRWRGGSAQSERRRAVQGGGWATGRRADRLRRRPADGRFGDRRRGHGRASVHRTLVPSRGRARWCQRAVGT
jgi:hypothetical protein